VYVPGCCVPISIFNATHDDAIAAKSMPPAAYIPSGLAYLNKEATDAIAREMDQNVHFKIKPGASVTAESRAQVVADVVQRGHDGTQKNGDGSCLSFLLKKGQHSAIGQSKTAAASAATVFKRRGFLFFFFLPRNGLLILVVGVPCAPSVLVRVNIASTHDEQRLSHSRSIDVVLSWCGRRNDHHGCGRKQADQATAGRREETTARYSFPCFRAIRSLSPSL